MISLAPQDHDTPSWAVVAYGEGYKYQLKKAFAVKLTFWPEPEPFKTDWLELDSEGVFTLSYGYAWDGVSGIAINTKNNLRGGLVHDGLYGAIRMGFLDCEIYRPQADEIFYQLCIADGMWSIRAKAYYQAVRSFGEKYAKPQDEVVLIAP